MLEKMASDQGDGHSRLNTVCIKYKNFAQKMKGGGDG